MLVITRRPGDRILFPTLGITIHVSRVDGRSVRLGVDAPRDVHVLRHELADEGRYQPRAEQPRANGEERAEQERVERERRHAVRNRLHTSLLSLHLLQRQLELGQASGDDLETKVAGLLRQLEAVEAELVSPGQKPRRSALVVEDNENERSLLAGVMQTHNYNVATANDGEDALAYLKSHCKPDVVLLDMNMPRLDGAATVREIRSNPDLCGVKLIAVSGMEQRQAKVVLGRHGVDRWFTKPVRPDLLMAEIDRELAGRG
ncbi:MAG: response regulator, partial [Pirellulaceae bacterium]